MAVMIPPTKASLIKAKSSLQLAKKGFELLDKKRNVLIREMMNFVNKSKDVHEEIYDSISKAYESLQVANITLGVKTVEDISYSVPDDESFELLLKSVMGVDIPSVKFEETKINPTYGFYHTNSAIDEARLNFNKAKYKIYELAEIENSIFKLAKEIQKTQKRTNALQHIQIPKYTEQVKHIQGVLEEKERDDFFRLKRVKNLTKE